MRSQLENPAGDHQRRIGKLNPTVLAMCEVGEVMQPLSQEQMQLVADQVMNAWRNAATKGIKLRCMFTQGSPYLTVYIDGPFQCSNHQILHDLYSAKGQPCVAQTFVFSSIDIKIDVINVHAPSGNGQWLEFQSKALLTTLLKSKSQAQPGCDI